MSEMNTVRANIEANRNQALREGNADASLAGPPRWSIQPCKGTPVTQTPRQPSEELTLPTDAEARKGIPIVTGLLDYFPAALAEVAKVSKAGNDKHNPGEPLHWARGKSMDQADCIGRHLMERGGTDPETGQLHSAQMAWRALALLQLELEEAGAPRARGAY